MNYPEIYAVDFDGTLNTARTYLELGAPNVDLFEFLKERRAAGDKIILWTCREGELLKAAVKYCGNYGLFFDAVNDNLTENIEYFGNNCRKIWAHHYIDDKNTKGTVVLRSRLLREMMELLSEKIKDSEEEIEEYKGGSDSIGRAMAYAHYAMASEIKEKFESIFYKNAEDITNSRWNIEKRAKTERLTIPDEKIEGGVRKTVIDAREVKKNAMTIYWALKKYEDTGLTPEKIRELSDRDTPKIPIYQVLGDERYEQEPEWWECPSCGEIYDMDEDCDFCPNCGQRLLR